MQCIIIGELWRLFCFVDRLKCLICIKLCKIYIIQRPCTMRLVVSYDVLLYLILIRIIARVLLTSWERAEYPRRYQKQPSPVRDWAVVEL